MNASQEVESHFNLMLNCKMKSISQVSHRCVTPKRANKKSFFSKRSIQAKLNINQPGDVYEQEAEAIADKIIQIPDAETASTFFHPKPILTSSIQKKGSTETGIVAPTTSVEQTLNSTGQPIDKGTMSFMEQRFGYDFGNVQVHNNSSAHQSAADINAKAYTNGDHIVFGYGKYQPSTDFGKQLLAHE